MKNLVHYLRVSFLVVSLLSFMLIGCNTHKKEMEQMKVQTDSLNNQITQRDQTVNEFLSDFNEIQQNLNTIKEKEKIISMNTEKKGELKQDVKDQINQDIQDIYSLLQENKQKIASLNKKLKSSNIQIAEFQKMIDNMNEQIGTKDKEIEELKGELAKLNIQVAHLTSNIDSLGTVSKTQQQEIEQKTIALNTAYYAVGTKQELKDKKIITKEGGFIGLGKVTSVLSNVDMNNFTKIDITKQNVIPINKKKANIITNHPQNSYKLNKENEMIKEISITNPEQFWSVSKYLVVEVK